eukprot:16916-Heterococcus_DN1.PRE.2
MYSMASPTAHAVACMAVFTCTDAAAARYRLTSHLNESASSATLHCLQCHRARLLVVLLRHDVNTARRKCVSTAQSYCFSMHVVYSDLSGAALAAAVCVQYAAAEGQHAGMNALAVLSCTACTIIQLHVPPVLLDALLQL